MIVEFQKIEEISDGRVDFYSARLGENELYEFEYFDGKDFSKHEKEIQILYNVIDQIKYKTAKQYFFKHENAANALPKVSPEIIKANLDDFGIRLYCIRLTDNVLILLNGDIKTKQNPMDCDKVRIHFMNAIKIANKLDKALLAREINYQNVNCLVGYEIDI